MSEGSETNLHINGFLQRVGEERKKVLLWLKETVSVDWKLTLALSLSMRKLRRVNFSFYALPHPIPTPRRRPRPGNERK